MIRIATDQYDAARDCFEVSDGLITTYFAISDLVWYSRGDPKWKLDEGGLSFERQNSSTILADNLALR